jgi:hypothetical protein
MKNAHLLPAIALSSQLLKHNQKEDIASIANN